ncbi:MAG TPA: PAS domain-containing protein, partial [Aquabacterium sp.]|nr:PAS domain-containing protein [Aquabacterium sp.]
SVTDLRGGCLQQWIPNLAPTAPAGTDPQAPRELIAHCGDERSRPVSVQHTEVDHDGQVLTLVSLVDLSDRQPAHQTQVEIHRLNAALAERVNEQAATLLQRERDLQAILDHAPAVMGYWDAQLRNRFANHAYRDWFGVEPERLPGMHIREMLGEARYRANLPYLMGALRGEPQYFEPLVPRPEGGGARHAQAHYLPDIDEQGVVRGFYVTVIDVTPIKDAQARAEELLHFSEAIFEQSPVGMCVFTQEGSCVTANSAMAQLVGASVSEVRQLNFRQLDSWKESHILPLADATLQDGQLRRTEIHVKSSFGREIHASISMSRVDRDGQPHLLLIAQDVTEQKQVHDELVAARDAARDAARTKSTFLANMSHEIRTPMNAIVGLSRLSLEDHLPPRSREYLDKVHSSALALMGILDEVLDYSKIEAGQMHIESAPVDLQDVLRRVSDLFSGRIEQKGLTFKTSLGQDVPPWIMGDSLRLA